MSFKIDIKDGKVIEGDVDATRAVIPFAGLPDEKKALLSEYVRNTLVAVVGEPDLTTAVSALLLALVTLCEGTNIPLGRISATVDMIAYDSDAESACNAKEAVRAAVAFRQDIMRRTRGQ